MVRVALALSSFILLAAATAQAAPQPAPANCPLKVDFASYAMGIDAKALDKVGKLLAADRGVKRVDQQRWGREGEMSLCAQTRSRADASRLFYRIKRVLPAKPRGPITVETASGLSFHAPRR